MESGVVPVLNCILMLFLLEHLTLIRIDNPVLFENWRGSCACKLSGVMDDEGQAYRNPKTARFGKLQVFGLFIHKLVSLDPSAKFECKIELWYGDAKNEGCSRIEYDCSFAHSVGLFRILFVFAIFFAVNVLLTVNFCYHFSLQLISSVHQVTI